MMKCGTFCAHHLDGTRECHSPHGGLLFFPPYAPELQLIERLWRDLKDWLATSPPTTLAALSLLLGTRLKQSSPARLHSLTGFPYLLSVAQQVIGSSSWRNRIKDIFYRLWSLRSCLVLRSKNAFKGVFTLSDYPFFHAI